MSHPMVRLLFLLVLLVVVAEGVPRAKKVRCKDKKFPNCYKQDRFCPNACLRTCVVDCVSCQPVCIAPPPPPPSPPPPPPKQKKLRSPPPPRRMPPPPRTPPTHPPPPPPTSAPPLPPLPPLNPPPETETSPAKAYCRNRDYPHCYRMEQSCPSGCPNQCEVDCVTCSPVCDCNRPGAVCQDPRFTGGDGISFYFHGKKDHNFCIVSDSNLHINAHFIGKTNQSMKRDFTWVQSLGLLFDTHKLVISAKKTAIWNNAYDHLDLTFNDEPLVISPIQGGKWNSNKTPYLTITRPSEVNSVVIEVEGNFKIKAKVVPITEKESRVHNYGITQENCFAHLDLGFKFYSLTGNVSGVLGQTYGSNYLSRVKMGVDMPVLGGDKEFMSSTLLSTDCAAARFSGRLDSVINSEYGDLNCGSGIHGGGVICKR